MVIIRIRFKEEKEEKMPSYVCRTKLSSLRHLILEGSEIAKLQIYNGNLNRITGAKFMHIVIFRSVPITFDIEISHLNVAFAIYKTAYLYFCFTNH